MKKLFPIITTSVRAAHNPGDTFIGIGGQYVFEETFGPTNWHVINKFGNKQTWESNEKIIRESGIVYYAGMPQYNNYDDWCFWYDKGLWEEVIEPWGLKVISLAGGAGFPDAEMTPQQFTDRCLKSEKTVSMLKARKENLVLTSVRDEHAKLLLDSLGIENSMVACTALFAPRQANIISKRKENVVLVPPNTKSIPEKYLNGKDKEEAYLETWLPIIEGLKKEYKKLIVICHWHDEFFLLREHLEENEIFFTTDYLSLLNMYKNAKLVISARLHGAIPAFGITGIKVVSVAIDTRGHAAGLIEKIPVVTYGNLNTDSILEASREARASEAKDIDNILKEYQDILLKVKELEGIYK